MKSTTVLAGNKSDSRKSEWQLNALETGADEEEEQKVLAVLEAQSVSSRF